MDSNEYMNHFSRNNTNNTSNDAGATPIIPLPNPGEGGPVYDGGTDNGPWGGSNGTGNGWGSGGMGNGSMNEPVVTPVIPLPNPGEGGPVYDGGTDNGTWGGNNGTGNGWGGGNMNGGSNNSGLLGTIITVLPRPVTSCFYCNSASYGTIRFLNAAIGYNPFVISVNNRTAVDTLEYAEVSDYGRVSSGTQTISIAGRNGYIYVSKQVRITVGSTMTIAIVNTAGGLDFVEINDTACYTPLGGSCVRVANLSYNAGPLTLSTYSGNVVFRNVSYPEVTNYVRVVPARYDIFVSNANEVLLSSELTVRSNSQYTIYLFNWNESPSAIRTLIIEDRK